MGFCAINQLNEFKFPIENPTREQISFKFESSVFNLVPNYGTIEPKSKVIITVQWTPKEAIVLVSTAILNIANEDPFPLKISGIGKYPYLDLSAKKLDFETLLVSKKK
jgi:hypothetical protein